MKLFLSCLFLIVLNSAYCQKELIYTQSFTDKLNNNNIEFFQPVERWLHATDITEDEFMSYDIVLHDEYNLEVRMKVIEDSKYFSQHPHIEVMRMLASISTNNQYADIKISQMNYEWVAETYGADWGLFADFIPKNSFSRFPKGRTLCLYKEGRALVSYIVLHDEDELDPYFEMPLMFK